MYQKFGDTATEDKIMRGPIELQSQVKACPQPHEEVRCRVSLEHPYRTWLFINLDYGPEFRILTTETDLKEEMCRENLRESGKGLK